MTDRQKQILEELTHANRMEVNALAVRLGVSQVTVRKDLAALEKIGLIRREFGFACIGSRDDLNTRLAYHYEEKTRIARMAAELVEPGENVMIESGSCCVLLAEELVKRKRDVTIITNSAFIAGYLRSHPAARVILLGGNYQPEAQVMVGPLVRTCAEQFFVDKLFIGTDGYRSDSGFTSSDMLRAEAVNAMRRQVQRTIILTESQKFSTSGVVSLVRNRDVYAVCTDANVPKEAEDELTACGVQIYKA